MVAAPQDTDTSAPERNITMRRASRSSLLLLLPWLALVTLGHAREAQAFVPTLLHKPAASTCLTRRAQPGTPGTSLKMSLQTPPPRTPKESDAGAVDEKKAKRGGVEDIDGAKRSQETKPVRLGVKVPEEQDVMWRLKVSLVCRVSREFDCAAFSRKVERVVAVRLSWRGAMVCAACRVPCLRSKLFGRAVLSWLPAGVARGCVVVAAPLCVLRDELDSSLSSIVQIQLQQLLVVLWYSKTWWESFMSLPFSGPSEAVRALQTIPRSRCSSRTVAIVLPAA